MTQDLWLFIAASVVLIVAPGPDLLFLLIQGIARGARAALPLALGLALGNVVHTAAAALGASLILRSSAAVLLVFKLCGAAYLLYAAWKTLRESRAPPALAGAGVAGDGRRMFLRGILMNVINPKVSLFFLAFLPQFVPAGATAPGLRMLGLGALFVVLTALIFGALSLLAARLGDWLQHRPGTLRVLAWVAAAVLVGMSIRLLLI